MRILPNLLAVYLTSVTLSGCGSKSAAGNPPVASGGKADPKEAVVVDEVTEEVEVDGKPDETESESEDNDEDEYSEETSLEDTEKPSPVGPVTENKSPPKIVSPPLGRYGVPLAVKPVGSAAAAILPVESHIPLDDDWSLENLVGDADDVEGVPTTVKSGPKHDEPKKPRQDARRKRKLDKKQAAALVREGKKLKVRKPTGKRDGNRAPIASVERSNKRVHRNPPRDTSELPVPATPSKEKKKKLKTSSSRHILSVTGVKAPRQPTRREMQSAKNEAGLVLGFPVDDEGERRGASFRRYRRALRAT
jgi:hypothetical protein